MSDIHVSILPPAALAEPTRAGMYALMDANYEGMDTPTFRADLESKDFAMVGWDRQQRVVGFTTGRWFDLCVDRTPYRILFSGDTIIDQHHRGNPHWAMCWLRYVLNHKEGDNVWWMLVSKGHLTYRYLPVWFQRYWPCVDERITPAGKRLRDALGQQYAPGRYDPSRGLVPASDSPQRLCAGVGAIDDRHRNNAHVRFFQQQNPRWMEGDELICLARLHADNLRRRWRDIVSRGER